ncbi:DEAD/DEAH box helicase, partial [archaeon]
MADAILRALTAGTRVRASPAKQAPAPATATATRATPAAPARRPQAHKPTPHSAHKHVVVDEDVALAAGGTLFGGRGAGSQLLSPAPSPPSSKQAGGEALIAADAGGLTREQAREVEEQTAFRHRVGMKVTGSAVPHVYATFSDLPATPTAEVLATLTATAVTGGAASVSGCVDGATLVKRAAAVRRALLTNIERSAYVEPTAVQMQSLPTMMTGRDCLAIAPTGSGKTAAFVLPLLWLLQGHDAAAVGPRALIIVPTKELASQTKRVIDFLGTGISVRSLVLSRAVVTGSGGGTISATTDASDLVRIHARRHH